MGKRKKRLHSPKYARKYASVRETYNRLRAVTSEARADGVVTEREADLIEEAKEAVVEAVVEAAVEKVEEVASVIVEKLEEEAVEVKTKAPAKKTVAPKKRGRAKNKVIKKRE